MSAMLPAFDVMTAAVASLVGVVVGVRETVAVRERDGHAASAAAAAD